MSTVFVTGASAGLGRAIAHAFSRDGHAVGLVARDPDALAATAAELPGKSAWAAADVARFDALEEAAARLEAELGPPEIWVNDAMVTVFARFEDIAPEEFARVAEVTFLGSVYGLRIALESMKPRGRGHLIQIGSALAYRPIPLQAPYCSCKMAIRGAVDSLRSELIHDRSPLHVTTVHMPAMNTPQFDWACRHVPHRPQPVPPIYDPEDCARAVVWAARHPQMREVWVGKPTFQAILGNKLLPAFMDRYMAMHAYEQQYESRADTDAAEGNLFGPVAGLHRTKGRFESREKPGVLWVGMSEGREKLFYGALALIALLVAAGLLAV